MKDMFFNSFFGGYMLGVAGTTALFVLIATTLPEGPGYKEGQIDAVTGKMKYELVENPDMTKEWKRKK